MHRMIESALQIFQGNTLAGCIETTVETRSVRFLEKANHEAASEEITPF